MELEEDSREKYDRDKHLGFGQPNWGEEQMARFDEVIDSEDIKPEKWYIVAGGTGGYSTKEEALAYARTTHISPKRIELIPGRGYFVLQKGKDISKWTMITGGALEY